MKISISKLIVIFIVGFLVYLIIKWNVSTNQIQNLCKDTKINNSILVVKESVKDSWLLGFSDMNLEGKNILLVHSSASFGRYTCSIEYKDGKVVNTDYSHLD